VVGARQGAPQVGGGGEALVVREQAVGERGEDVAAAHRVVARPLLGRRLRRGVAGRAVLEEHAGDAEGVGAEEHRFLPPQVAAWAVQLLDGDQCHGSESGLGIVISSWSGDDDVRVDWKFFCPFIFLGSGAEEAGREDGMRNTR